MFMFCYGKIHWSSIRIEAEVKKEETPEAAKVPAPKHVLNLEFQTYFNKVFEISFLGLLFLENFSHIFFVVRLFLRYSLSFPFSL